ncbi:PAS domain-containing protein [Streptomyces vietnamensis]|uniref:PAS domain-containing protein n=1 Tax=Streptomyces vietnamensis TaxID=362257 RepID=UPI00378C84AD
MATAVLDQRGDVIGWDAAAQELYGYLADDGLGKPARRFFVPVDGRPLLDLDVPVESWGEKRALRKRGGGVVEVVLYVLRLGPGEARPATAAWGILSVAAERMERWVTDQAMLAGLSTHSPAWPTVYRRFAQESRDRVCARLSIGRRARERSRPVHGAPSAGSSGWSRPASRCAARGAGRRTSG